MRSSYRSYENESTGEVEGYRDSYITVMLISAYYDMYGAIEKELGSVGVEGVSEEIDGEQADEIEEGTDTPNEDDKSYKFKRNILVAICAVSAVVVAGMSFWLYSLNKNSAMDIESIEKRVCKLYTSDSKDDIKSNVSIDSLDRYYDQLDKLPKKKNKVSKDAEILEDELDTIGSFIGDKSKLESYNNKDYDLSDNSLIDSLQEIRENTKGYSISGLAITINNMTSGIEDTYNEFVTLRQELSGVEDATSFNYKKYKSRIEELGHTPNQEELMAIANSLNKSKKEIEKKQKAEELAKQKAEEASKKAAEVANEKAKEIEKKAQEKIDATKQQAQEQLRKAAEEIKNLEARQKALEQQQQAYQQQQNQSSKATETPSADNSSGVEDTNESVEQNANEGNDKNPDNGGDSN